MTVVFFLSSLLIIYLLTILRLSSELENLRASHESIVDALKYLSDEKNEIQTQLEEQTSRMKEEIGKNESLNNKYKQAITEKQVSTCN